MESNNTKIFVNGLFSKKVPDTAPAWVIANLSVHRESLLKWLTENPQLADEQGYIRMTIKESKEGKRYTEVDTWKPTTPAPAPANPNLGEVPASQLPPF